MTDIPNVRLHDAYGPAVRFALAIQAFFLVFSQLILDCGYTTRIVATAMLAFWAAALMLILRSPQAAKKVDLIYIRAGFLPILVLTYLAAQRVWTQ